MTTARAHPLPRARRPTRGQPAARPAPPRPRAGPRQSEVSRILGEHEPHPERYRRPARLRERFQPEPPRDQVGLRRPRRARRVGRRTAPGLASAQPEWTAGRVAVREVEAALYACVDAALEGIDAGPAPELPRRPTAGEPAGEALAKRLAATEARSDEHRIPNHRRSSRAPVRGILLRPLALPEWNPAFLAIGGSAHAGDRPPSFAHGHHGLRGEFRYLAIEPDRVDMEWNVPGMLEQCSWLLEPEHGGTRVSHEVHADRSRSYSAARRETAPRLTARPSLRMWRRGAYDSRRDDGHQWNPPK